MCENEWQLKIIVVAYELFDCVWPFCGGGAKNLTVDEILMEMDTK